MCHHVYMCSLLYVACVQSVGTVLVGRRMHLCRLQFLCVLVLDCSVGLASMQLTSP